MILMTQIKIKAAKEPWFLMKVLNNFKIGSVIISLLAVAMLWASAANAAPKDLSDLNSDGLIDLADLTIFSTNYLERNWETVDWCLFYDSTITGEDFNGKSTDYYLKRFKLLLTFIRDFAACGSNPDPDPEPDPDPPLLKLVNQPKLLLRAAESRDGSGNFYFTDPRVGSLYIYDSSLSLTHEIKGLDKPLGVGVNALGQIFIGNDGRDNIEVYDPADGNLLAIFGEGLLKMPTAITFDVDGNIYVTDSRNHNIRVFDTAYNLVRTIGSAGEGESELNFPMDTEVITWNDAGTMVQEVVVADQGNKRIQFYDTEGNHLSSIIEMEPPPPPPGVKCGWFNPDPECIAPEFGQLQALSVDSLGRLHALDLLQGTVLVLDPASGAFIGSYGEYGNGPGFLKIPMDVLVSSTGKAIVTSGDGSRIVELETP